MLSETVELLKEKNFIEWCKKISKTILFIIEGERKERTQADTIINRILTEQSVRIQP